MRNKIGAEVHKLAAQLKDHIWFPQNTREGYLFRYGTTFLFGLLVVAVLLWIPVFQSKTVSYVIFLLAICLSSFVGTFTSGFLLTGFATSTLILFFQPTLLSLQSSIEILSFIATGIVISVIIHRCKRADLGNEFARREHEYKKTISQLTQEKLEAIKEIRVRDEFISIASHELKTPLTTTLLKLQTALHNVRHVTLANFSVQNLLDMLESAELQSKRLAKMINDLLNVSIIRTGRLELEREECDVVVIAKEVVSRFAEKAEKEGVELRVDAKGTIPAFCDKVRLEQVISNLISNAIKYGKAKPIDVFVWKSGNVAKISIKDRGIGISPDKREKVFNLFERAVGNGEYKGLGIGLYITNQIVKAHNGKITVQSKVNSGSEFVVEIPLK